MIGGDVVLCATDQVDSNYLYPEIAMLELLRSKDGGLSVDYGSGHINGRYYSAPNWYWKPDPYRIPDAQNEAVNWVAPVVIDPNNSNRLLAGGASLWRPNDARTPNTNSSGPSWSAIKSPAGSDESSYISAIAIATADSNIIWVGHNNGAVYYTTTGTAADPTWTQANLGSPNLPARFCERITIDPQDQSKVYVTFGGYSPDNIWRTTNNGVSWTNIASGLPSAPVRSLVVSPTDSNMLYIGAMSAFLPLLTAERLGRGLFEAAPQSPPPTPTPGPSGTPTPTPTPAAPSAQAINLSTRMRVQTGNSLGIGGFIITGGDPKQVLLRAIGPSLSGSDITNPLADPLLELHGPDGFTNSTNNNWRDTQQQEIQATGLAPTDNLESAILVTLNPGAYTAIVSGNGGGTGVGSVEIYDLAQGAAAKLGNISTRAFVGTDESIVIAGFILGTNSGQDRIVVRGIGPSLTAVGVPNALADPTLELRDSNGALIIADNDWEDDAFQAAELTASGLAPDNPLESALAATLSPGTYTALLGERNTGNGVGLVEVYDRGSGP